MTPWVMALMLVNALVYLATMSSPFLAEQLALIPFFLPVRPWTAMTYMFVHAGMGHIFFNMLGLYFFGPPLEARLGGKRFAILWFVSGITGGLLSVLTSPAAVVGASGAVYGVMLGFAWFWPRQQIMIWGIIPVEARWLVVIFTVASLYLARSGDGVAHFAHLGGFFGAWLFLKWVGGRPAAARAAWQKWMAPAVPAGMNPVERWKKINAAALHPVNREEYERVIAKLDKDGSGALTPGEREFLDRFSQAAG